MAFVLSNLAMFPRRAIVCVLLVAGCKKADAPKEREQPRPARPEACGGPKETTGAIAWFEDDLGRAKACAKERNLPLVLDEWAPWCHTCLSMKTTIFTDPAFAPLAERFVWVATDTDKEVNADVVATYPPAAWPTFWVIDGTGAVAGRYVGSASVDQFRDFLIQGERTALAGAKLDPESADGKLVTADRLAAEAGKLPKGSAERAAQLSEAAGNYVRAIAVAPADWPRRPDVLVSAMSAIAQSGSPAQCLGFADQHLNETGSSSSAADFVVTARACADAEGVDPAAAKAARAKFAARLDALLADASAPLSADDRADALANLRDLYDQLDRHADALATAEKSRALLDAAAAAAPTPFAAMTYNWPRAEVYAYLKQYDALVPALEKSAADLPEEYDPPYRLAWIYQQAGKLDLALEWANKSVALAYGPRKARVQTLIADVLHAQGKTADELAARRALVEIYEKLPAGQARPDDLAKARADLAALE